MSNESTDLKVEIYNTVLLLRTNDRAAFDRAIARIHAEGVERIHPKCRQTDPRDLNKVFGIHPSAASSQMNEIIKAKKHLQGGAPDPAYLYVKKGMAVYRQMEARFADSDGEKGYPRNYNVRIIDDAALLAFFLIQTVWKIPGEESGDGSTRNPKLVRIDKLREDLQRITGIPLNYRGLTAAKWRVLNAASTPAPVNVKVVEADTDLSDVEPEIQAQPVPVMTSTEQDNTSAVDMSQPNWQQQITGDPDTNEKPGPSVEVVDLPTLDVETLGSAVGAAQDDPDGQITVTATVPGGESDALSNMNEMLTILDRAEELRTRMHGLFTEQEANAIAREFVRQAVEERGISIGVPTIFGTSVTRQSS